MLVVTYSDEYLKQFLKSILMYLKNTLKINYFMEDFKYKYFSFWKAQIQIQYE